MVQSNGQNKSLNTDPGPETTYSLDSTAHTYWWTWVNINMTGLMAITGSKTNLSLTWMNSVNIL